MSVHCLLGVAGCCIVRRVVCSVLLDGVLGSSIKGMRLHSSGSVWLCTNV